MRTSIALTLVVAVGLATRRAPELFGAFVAEHGGDALWATAAYLAVALAAPTLSPTRTAAVALGIAIAVESSQLVQAEWLERVRDLPGMRLLLGYGFDGWDLARYAVGVSIGAAIDPWLRGRRL